MTLQDEVDEINNTNVMGRTIKLYVDRVGTDVPLPKRYKEKRMSPRVIELNKHNAMVLRDHLDRLLKNNLPGAISFVLYGREEL